MLTLASSLDEPHDIIIYHDLVQPSGKKFDIDSCSTWGNFIFLQACCEHNHAKTWHFLANNTCGTGFDDKLDGVCHLIHIIIIMHISVTFIGVCYKGQMVLT